MIKVPIEALQSSNLYVLSDNAGAVFDGTLADKQIVTRPGRKLIYTQYTFHVASYLKGEQTEAILTIVNVGGHASEDGRTLSTAHSYNLQLGQRYLVFLRQDYESLVLPIITVMSIHDDGNVIASDSGYQLTALDAASEMSFAAQRHFGNFRYGRRLEGRSMPTPPPTPAPTPTSVGARVNPQPGSTGLASPHTNGGVTMTAVKALLSR